MSRRSVAWLRKYRQNHNSISGIIPDHRVRDSEGHLCTVAMNPEKFERVHKKLKKDMDLTQKRRR